MKRPQSLSLILKPLLLALLFVGIQCKPKDEAGPAAPQGSSSASPSAVQPAAVAKAPSLVDHATKLGFAAKLPQGTEFYVGSVNLKAHIAALKSSAWFKDVSGLMEDKTPAPTAGDKSLATLEKLFGDDVFIAGAQGFAASAAQLRNINRVYNEVYFKIIMTGGVSGAFGAAQEGAAPNPLAFMQNFLQDAATLEKLAGVINTLELPPLIAGFKVEKPEEILAVLANTKELEEKKIVVMSDLTTPQGHKFRVATMDVSTVLTDEQQKMALAALPPDTPEASRKIIEKAIADLRSKKFLVGWGSVGDHVIFACGKNLDHLKFVESPAQSLLAKPELAWLVPHAAKNLTGVNYMSAASIESLNDDQPIVPMLRGAVSALRENATFKAIGEALEPQVTALSALESKVYHGEATDLVAASWWDKGFHAEAVGGLKPKFVLPGKPLRYHQLVNKPGVILGLAFHRNKEYDIAVRAWMEQLFSIAYTAAKELVKAGIAGPQGGQSFAMFELMLLPQLKSVYQADRDIDEKGLGGEIAYVIDVNGKMPNIPGMPEAAKDIKFPRISTISDVASRAELAKGWTTINETITGVAAIIGGFAGGQPGPDGKAKPPFVMPVPQSSKSGDMTTWFYTGEFFSGDLNPAASISDKLLVLSTSKDAAESFAADLSKPAAGGVVEGAVWRIDPSAVAEWVGKASALNPNATPEETKELKQVLNWLKPFRVMQGRVYEDKGQWKMSLDWDVSDVVKFD